MILRGQTNFPTTTWNKTGEDTVSEKRCFGWVINRFSDTSSEEDNWKFDEKDRSDKVSNLSRWGVKFAPAFFNLKIYLRLTFPFLGVKQNNVQQNFLKQFYIWKKQCLNAYHLIHLKILISCWQLPLKISCRACPSLP